MSILIIFCHYLAKVSFLEEKSGTAIIIYSSNFKCFLYDNINKKAV